MKDNKDDIIYVGKAKNLKNRVKSYFRKTHDSNKVSALVDHIVSFDYIIVDNEIESLILESNLIKLHNPKYNILLRDDKQYPYIKITNEIYPRIIKDRELKDDGSQNFGPFPSATAVNIALGWINREYKLRTCRRNLTKISPVCLKYHLGLCDAPCERYISEEEYNKKLLEPINFFMGKQNNIIKNLTEKMLEFSRQLEFEKAQEIKNIIDSLELLKKEQKITIPTANSSDFIAGQMSSDIYVITVFYQRDGQIVGKNTYSILHNNKKEEELLSEFIKQNYLTQNNLPKELILEKIPHDIKEIEEAVKLKTKRSSNFVFPQKGAKFETLKLVKRNAQEELFKHKNRHLEKSKRNENATILLTEIINTGEIPQRIESFDISHIQGTDAVGSMIVYINGYPNKNEYRKFKIKKANPKDDLACMMEIIERRFIRYIEKSKGFDKIPDLILMDGSINQINACKKILDKYNLSIPVMGMVKNKKHITDHLIFEEEFIDISKNKDLLSFITEIQNEVHRFAINAHRSLRSKTLVKSKLDEIKGIGTKRKQNLIKKFGCYDEIKNASIEELASTDSMNKKIALKLKEEMEKYDY